MRLFRQRGSRPLSFEAFGVRVELMLGEAGLNAAVEEILPPGWRPCAASKSAGKFGLRQTDHDGYEVTVGDTPWLEHGTLDVALGMLDAQIRIHIASSARDLIFVHAGVVAAGGRAMAIPGESFIGKTTLVRALVEAGADYYSDEYAVLDGDGRVHPYARRLSIRSDDGTSTDRAVSELGGKAAQGSAELATIIVTRYRSGGEWRPTRLSTGEGVLAMLANTVPAQDRPQASLRVLSRALAGATVMQSDRGEAGAVAPLLLEELRAGAAGPRRAAPT